jgi:hypothetical protein
VLDRVQCEVLIDFQAFLALMARDELDLRIRQTVRGQPGDHLVAEEMRLDRLGNAGAPAVAWSYPVSMDGVGLAVKVLCW